MDEYLKEAESLYKMHYELVDKMSLSSNQKKEIAVKNLILNVENQYNMICECDFKDKHIIKEDLRLLVLFTHKYVINLLLNNE